MPIRETLQFYQLETGWDSLHCLLDNTSGIDIPMGSPVVLSAKVNCHLWMTLYFHWAPLFLELD